MIFRTWRIRKQRTHGGREIESLSAFGSAGIAGSVSRYAKVIGNNWWSLSLTCSKLHKLLNSIPSSSMHANPFLMSLWRSTLFGPRWSASSSSPASCFFVRPVVLIHKDWITHIIVGTNWHHHDLLYFEQSARFLLQVGFGLLDMSFQVSNSTKLLINSTDSPGLCLFLPWNCRWHWTSVIPRWSPAEQGQRKRFSYWSHWIRSGYEGLNWHLPVPRPLAWCPRWILSREDLVHASIQDIGFLQLGQEFLPPDTCDRYTSSLYPHHGQYTVQTATLNNRFVGLF